MPYRLLAVLLAWTALLPPAAAAAQPAAVLPSPGLVELLPAGPVVGDGHTPVTLHLLVLAPDGNPVHPSRARLSTREGRLEGGTEVAPGVLAWTWTPPETHVPRGVRLRFRGRLGTTPVDRTFTIHLDPAPPTAITLRVNPPALVPGQDASATVEVVLEGWRAGTGPQPDLTLSASSGRIADLAWLGEGRFSARYVPPEVGFPHLAILTARSGPSVGAAAIPLAGRTNFPVQGTPGATVLLKVGDRDYGPYTLDASGRASLPIQVPPGIRTGRLTVVTDGVSQVTEVDLKVPETRRIAILPIGERALADPARPQQVHAVVFTPDGHPDPDAPVEFTATAGAIGPVEQLRDGLYRVTWRPPTLVEPSRATVQVALAGASGVQADARTLDLLPAPPLRVTLSADPPHLEPGTSALTIHARVVGADERDLPGHPPVLFPTGARLAGPIEDLGNGGYRARALPEPAGPVRLTAAAPGVVGEGEPAALVLVPDLALLPPDGVSATGVTALALDAWGRPLAGVPIAFTVPQGSASVTERATTDGRGLARAILTAGQKPGLVRLTATAGEARETVPLLLLALPADAAPRIPVGGTPERRARIEAWSARIPTLTVPRVEAAAAMVAAPAGAESGEPAAAAGTRDAEPAPPTASSGNEATVAPPGSPPTSLVLRASPEVAAAGERVEVDVQALDAALRGVAGLALDVMVSAGGASAPADRGDGHYAFTVTLPEGLDTDSVRVVVSTLDGSLVRILKLPVQGGASEGAPAAEPPPAGEAATGPPTGGSPAEPAAAVAPEPAAAAVVRGVPLWRVRLGGVAGTYAFSQVPEAGLVDNPLWDTPVDMTRAPALTGGADLFAQGWLPMLPAVGAELGARATRYGFVWPGTELPIYDWVPTFYANGLARFTFSSGPGVFWAAARAGVLYGDFLTFLKGPDPGQVAYQPLPLVSFGAGAEVGAWLYERALLRAALLEGFRTIPPYSTNVEVEAAFRLWRELSVDVAWNLLLRSTPVLVATSEVEVGTLEDRASTVVVGLAWQAR